MNPSTARTFKVGRPHMKGDDVRDWQRRVKAILKQWDIDWDSFVADGDFGAVSRSATAAVIRGFGGSPGHLLEHGVTPEVRARIRDWQDGKFTPEQRARYNGKGREFSRALRKRHRDLDADYGPPIGVILEDSWGWHPGVHDGVDLICKPDAPLLAICDGKVVRADSGGWWGLGAPSDPAVRAKGDGIIVVRCTIDAGPFEPGLNFCYGHAEKATVRVGQTVEAGQVIGHAGLANAWHVHFMVNDNTDVRGVGDRDPMPYVTAASRGPR